MNFLAPGMLVAIGAVAAPVILHFMNQTRTRRMPWAAMRFLQESVEKNQRRMNVEDLLLLILRCLLLLLLAFVFARPVLNAAKSASLPGGPGPVAMALVLDDSMSTGQSDGVETRFDLAKKAASQTVKELAPGSECALFFVSNQVRKVIAQPTRDLALVRRNVETAEPGDRSSNLLPGIRAAVETLRKSSGLVREIVVFTDNQQLAWGDLKQIQALRDEIKDEMTLQIVPPGGEGEPNLAITSIRLEGTSVAVDQPVRCIVEVENWGKATSTATRVTLSLDSESPSAEGMVEGIPPGQTRILQLMTRWKSPGFHTLTATIPPDRLPADNTRSTAVLVPSQIRVLIVEGSTGKRRADQDGYFLSHALMPVRKSQEYFLKADTLTVGGLTAERIKGADIVILANVPRLDSANSAALRAFVEAGGGVMIFPGPSTDAGFYNNDPAFSSLLPAKLGTLTDAPQPAFLQKTGYTHPVTSIWNDPESGNLGAVNFSRYYQLSGDKSAGVVAAMANGQPAILEKDIGRGKVVLFNSTANPLWSNLALHPGFVPLLQRLVGFLSSHDQTPLVLTPGAVFSFPVDIRHVGSEFSVQRIGGERRVGGEVETAGMTGLVRFSGTDKAGAYQVFLGDESAPAVTFAVQTDPAESNLTTIASNDLANLNEASPTAKQPEDATVGVKPGIAREIWMMLAVAALAVAVAESILAHRASRSH